MLRPFEGEPRRALTCYYAIVSRGKGISVKVLRSDGAIFSGDNRDWQSDHQSGSVRRFEAYASVEKLLQQVLRDGMPHFLCRSTCSYLQRAPSGVFHEGLYRILMRRCCENSRLQLDM